jgi:hypothetical protein
MYQKIKAKISVTQDQINAFFVRYGHDVQSAAFHNDGPPDAPLSFTLGDKERETSYVYPFGVETMLVCDHDGDFCTVFSLVRREEDGAWVVEGDVLFLDDEEWYKVGQRGFRGEFELLKLTMPKPE